jgi:hypothetical protein
MLIDNLLTFASALAITETGDATNCIDLKAAGLLGSGKPLQVVIKIDVAADATTGDETYAFSVTTDDNAALTSDTTIATKTIAAAALAINTLHTIDIPENVATERYLGLVATLAGTTPSVKYTAWLAEKGSIPTTPAKGKFANGWDA